MRAERDQGGEREGRAVQPAGPRCADVRRGAGARFGGEEAAGAEAGGGPRGARGVVGVVLRISRCGRRRRGGGAGEGSRGSSALVGASSSSARLDRLPDYRSDGSWPGGSCLPLELAVVERRLGLACDGVVADG